MSVTQPLGVPLIIANPSAGRADGSVLQRLLSALRTDGVHPEVAMTAARGHASTLARAAAEEGRRFVIAVGGDGTVHEVVNGLVDADTGRVRGDDPVLGVVGGGSGCDLLRTFGLDRPPEVLARHLATADTTRIDLGRVRYHRSDGTPQVRVFANIAEVGYGGTVSRLANRLPRRLGHARYVTAIVGAVPHFRRMATTVEVAGGTTSEPVCNVIVANGQFFGGGLRVAPRALPTDGALNVQSWGGHPVDVIRAQPQLRTGAHLARADVREWSSPSVTVTNAEPRDVEADGEHLGVSPASFDVLQQVLRFKL
ncbi:MAG: YegS/Rv2252/BmrU family lipid kinase [Nitriliruptoraceae bacterium]